MRQRHESGQSYPLHRANDGFTGKINYYKRQSNGDLGVLGRHSRGLSSLASCSHTTTRVPETQIRSSVVTRKEEEKKSGRRKEKGARTHGHIKSSSLPQRARASLGRNIKSERGAEVQVAHGIGVRLVAARSAIFLIYGYCRLPACARRDRDWSLESHWCV